ncbi:MAG TPA: hypothetical protein VHE33_01140 [Acidobacteriaceae bacterium]|nr:hypothetical protein [Acidobacteriaceae bacterium]
MKRGSYIFASVVAAAILTAGCNSGAKAASTGDGSGAPQSAQKAAGSPGAVKYVSGTEPSNSTATATLLDPTLNNMPAATLTVPEGWKTQGMMMTSPCTTLPVAVFRSYSPDGLMQMRAEPAMGWAWTTEQKMATVRGCLPLQKPVTAAQFLDAYIGMIQGGVHVVGAIELPQDQHQALAQRIAQLNQMEAQSPVMAGITNSGDMSAVRIETVNGSFVIEERLRATVMCQLNNNPGFQHGGTCFAQVDQLMAPKGRLDGLMRTMDSQHLPRAKASDQWFQAMMQQRQRQWDEFGRKLRALEQQESEMLAQQAQQFSQRMASDHAAYMQQQESEYQSERTNFNAQMNAKSTAASDWVDYALDRQTVAVGGTTAKISSAYSQTWSNGSQWYQTNDPNANPNGVLPGNWTLATQVHGNGQPK